MAGGKLEFLGPRLALFGLHVFGREETAIELAQHYQQRGMAWLSVNSTFANAPAWYFRSREACAAGCRARAAA
jgi:hypothetical protein